MGRGRGRGGGGGGGGGGSGRSRGGGGGFRRGGGGGRSRGRGRGGRGGFDERSMSRKNATHMQQFGEQHPSEDVNNFSPSNSKRGKYERQDFRGRGGRGRGRGQYHNFNNRRMGNVSSDNSSESEEEVTPYDQLLAVYSGDKSSKKTIQIVSESESEGEDSADSLEEEGKPSDNDEQSVSELEDDHEDKNSLDSDADTDNSLEAEGKNVDDTNDVAGNSGDDNSIDENGDTEADIDNPLEDETVIADAEIDPELNDESLQATTIDPFITRFEGQMNENMQQELKTEKPYKTHLILEWPVIEQFHFNGLNPDSLPTKGSDSTILNKSKLDLSAEKCRKVPIVHPSQRPPKDVTLEQLHVKKQLHCNLAIANQRILEKESSSKPLTPLQTEVYSMLSEYYDFYYTQRNLQNADALRVAYCLHAANHVWKTRNRIVHHNAKMANKVEVPEEYRDQGFARPKVLILTPFKDSALKIVQTLTSIILADEKGAVANKKRFNDEYGGTTLFLPKTNPKPDDYMQIFGGNCDDNFKMGLSITKKSVKLYTGFYSSDIIVASPLGLRMIIGAEGEKDRDYDFLSSIEILIMDQADVFLMQNWDHLLHVMKHLHLQPVTTHGTDFGRIRPWALDGLTKHYCQTVVLSSYMCPEHNALFSRYCRNFSGCVKVVKSIFKGSICHVTVQLPQVFQQFDCASLQNVDDDRFDFFVKKVLPNFKDRLMSHTLVFVSSYFDFVRLRNYFKREEVSFVQICEYTKDKKIARARDLFFHNKNHFMLYTERAHFFRRFRLKGIGHIIFYQLPQNPHFYSELCDFIQEGFQNRRVRLRKNSSVNAIYCKYDAPRLSAIVGTERAAHMISSEKKVHAFVSGEF